MEGRAVARLAVVSTAALGAFVFAYHLGHGAPAASDAAFPVVVRQQAEPAPTLARTDARSRLEQGVAPTATTPGASSRRVPADPEDPFTGAQVVPVDETEPHTHVVDPRTGGQISVAGAEGTLPAADDLGPMHTDPLPAGVKLTDPTDTASLLERAGVVQAELASADQPVTVGATAPIGTPGISSLSSHVVPSCSGSGTDGKRVQVLYVHQKSTPSRYSQVLPALRNEVANVDDVFAVSAQQTGGLRRVRWVHDAGCLPVIKDVTVPDGALGSNFWDTVHALDTLGFNDANRKYLMFADANQFCGIGTLYNDERLTGNYNDGYAASYSRVDANCWSSGHSVAAHELTHNLGGVQQDAPHSTVNGHCWDEADIMCYADGSGVAMKSVCGSAQEQLLDCNHDDYFSTAPAAGTFLAKSWNTASSSFLDSVLVQPSKTAAQTGDTVTLTASGLSGVTWRWSTTPACTLTPGTSDQASMVCPSSVTGRVTVAASATNPVTGAAVSGTASVAVVKAAAPTVVVTAPSEAAAGTPFTVTGTATGKAPFRYDWSATTTGGGTSTCSVATPFAASTTVTCPSDAAAQFLTLAVSATQNDGQAGRGTATVAVADAGGTLPSKTAPSWSSPRTSGSTISATLGAAGVGVVGAPVRLQVKWYGTSTWVDVASLVTDARGTATSRSTYPRAGTFRFSYAGDVTRSGSLSPETYVRVSTRVAGGTGRRKVAATLTTVSGSRVTGARLTLQRRAWGSTRWVTVATVRTDSRGMAVKSLRPPRRTYYRWVFPGEATHLPAASSSLTVRR